MTSPRIAEQADAAGGAETPVVTGQDALDDLVALLDLERLEVNLFRGFSPAHSPTRVFGGQVAGQALVAAGRTVDPDRVVHSLHAYFVRPGDPRAPIIFDVERIRDGRSFTTRRVRAVQHGEVIFALAASFQLTQSGVEHTEPAPTGVPAPEDLPDLGEWLRGERTFLSGVPRPLDLRFVEAPLWSARRGPATDEPQRVWMRADGTLPDNPMLHVCLLTYASDLTLLASVLAPHPLHMGQAALASLDHAMWFHRPFRADEWLLYECRSPSAAGARGLATGRFFTRDGQLVVSAVQEGLVRVPDARRTIGEPAQQGLRRAAVPGAGRHHGRQQQHEPHPDGQQGRLRDRQAGAQAQRPGRQQRDEQHRLPQVARQRALPTRREHSDRSGHDAPPASVGLRAGSPSSPNSAA